jgi:hypothetical protein
MTYVVVAKMVGKSGKKVVGSYEPEDLGVALLVTLGADPNCIAPELQHLPDRAGLVEVLSRFHRVHGNWQKLF